MISKSVAPFLALGSASLALAQDFIATTGVVAQNGSAPIRRNINELASEAGPQWDLYIQSLWEMQGVDESDPLSFFQIAGIHGWPFVEYNGTGPGRQNNGWMGYCPHGEPLFLSWHRPYVALYEQTLVSHAKAIAAKYPEDRRNEYVQAAESLRSPFWDWGTSRDVPQVTVPRSVTINTAEGKKEVQNPLMTYKFPKDAIDGKFGNFAQIRRTPPGLPNPDSVYRCAAPKSYPKSADEALELKVNRNRNTDLGAMVYDIFTNSQNFAQFASTRDVGMSLEQIHNTIHVEAACGADMMNQYVSGYDPLFMLHHTQVDRLWSYWQAIHPDMADFSGSYSGGARFTTPAGSTINQDSPLMPFFDKNGKPHTSKSVASIKDFGYSYEALDGNKSPEQMASDATRLINKLYSGQISQPDEGVPGEPSAGSPSGSSPTSGVPTSGVAAPTGVFPPGASPNGTRPGLGPRPGSGNAPNAPSGGIPGNGGSGSTGGNGGNAGLAPIDESKRRYAQVQLEVDKIERPCFVNVYIGEYHAGSMYVMSEPSTGIVNGAVLLNSAIQKFTSKPGNGTARAFNDNVHVDITNYNGDQIDVKTVPSLKVNVEQIEVKPPVSENKLPEITRKKPEPANGGGALTPPPPSTDPAARPGGSQGGSGNGNGNGNGSGSESGKPQTGPKSAAATTGPLSAIGLALLAVPALLLAM